jgi:tripartite-type tricarboxylate transporter receptor subunit TctC
MKKIFLGLVASILLPATVSVAQNYPNRPVTVVVPYAPGGVVDLVGRSLARQLEIQFGQSVVVENKPGAGSQTGAGFVADSAPDGYTLMVVDPAVAINASLQPNVPYKMDELQTLATASNSPLIVGVNPAVPVKTLKELVEYSKANPGAISYGSAGVGTTTHLAPEMLKYQTGFDAIHIPYRGGGPSIPDLLSNRIQVVFYSNGTMYPLVKEGSVRAIAQTGRQRSEFTPADLPTGIESGYPDFIMELWTAVFAPAGLPDDVKAILDKELKEAIESEGFNTAIKNGGVEGFYQGGEDAEKFIKSEYERFGKLIKDANISSN